MRNKGYAPEINGVRDLEVSSGQARWILIICSLLFTVNCMDRQVLSAVLEPIKIDLGLSDTQVGSIQSGFLLAIALLAFPISYLVDRWSRRKAISLMRLFGVFQHSALD